MWKLARALGIDGVVPTTTEVLQPMPGDELSPGTRRGDGSRV